MENILIATTPTLGDEYVIEKYHGFISVELVTATSVFQDFLASFREIAGGISETYSEEVEILKDMVLEELKNKTRSLGMNCVLGIKVDLEPIFGQGASMFLLSASGTAARVRKKRETPLTEEEIKIENIKKELNNIKGIESIVRFPEDLNKATLKELYSITSYKNMEVAQGLIKLLPSLKLQFTTSSKEKKLKVLKEYFQTFPYDEISKPLCSNINEDNFRAIMYFELLDYEAILEGVKRVKNKEELWPYFNVLFALPKTITKNSFEGIKALIDYFEGNFNDTVKTRLVGAFTKKEMWVCKECRTECDMNDAICHYCSHDRYGLPKRFNYEKLMGHLRRIASIGEKYFL